MLLLLGCTGDYEVNTVPPDPGDTAPTIKLDPASLSFDPLALGDESTLPITVSNVGATPLHVSSFALTGTTAFALVDAPADATIDPDASISLTVRFSPVNPEDTASLDVASDDPTMPVATARLSGEALVPELRVTPDPLAFGDVPIDCVATRTLRLENAGLTDLLVSSVASDTSAFVLDGTAFPATLAPGETRSVDVSFTPAVTTEQSGAIYVNSDDLAGFRAVGVSGSGTPVTTLTDDFLQGEVHYDMADILLYVDGSGSMLDDQENLAANFGTLVEALAEADLDWRLAVVTDDDGCHNGPIFDLSTINTNDLLDAVRGPTGAWTEAGLSVAYAALDDQAGCNEGWRRTDARTMILLVSDEPEQSSWPAEVRVGQILTLAPDATIHAVAGDVPDGCPSAEPGTGYDVAAALTGGVFLSICDADWSAYFRTIADRTASDQTDTFPLSAWPDPATIDVTVDGAVAVGWTWSATLDAVVFDADHWPAPGATVSVQYAIDATCAG